MNIVFFVISFLASIVGAICGIGGGVMIKPTLDMFGLTSVATISFLSGCTVLSMSCYTVSKNIISKDNLVNFRTGTPLAFGGIIGGIIGKQLFELIKAMYANANVVGVVQSVCLGLITLSTLVYTLNKDRIKTHNIQSRALITTIGIVLGLFSCFLGIGGGPINLVVLYYFFSMDTKVAAHNSLYIILFSQVASLIVTLITGTVPEFQLMTLFLMALGGISGGVVGRNFNAKMDNKAIEKLFIILMSVIIGISIFNVFKYSFF